MYVCSRGGELKFSNYKLKYIDSSDSVCYT